uniref:Uncharacterized protein n=1 Tax=Candidatus Kentrum sp. LPFa TaxID=2126335 RepID=A0A450XC06_9GAMM|nr:MAG: hypothetical protein BECKLPF1236A_GA0070988_100392 [Candidatus Kentron sp. LPFa]VFK26823.1 MAG: hypothetical protein BECKLPF1236C_GA0070990_100392 [Candidatus Kentron sp. LPFa]
MYTTSLPNHVSGVHIDRTFTNPSVILALRHMDENILAEMLDDAEILEALMRIRESDEPTRSADEFFSELRKELD